MMKQKPNRPEEVSQRHAGSSGAAWRLAGDHQTLMVWKRGKTTTELAHK